ncbi:MAG: MotA/TolQ/ExbB proton channel family protein [Chlamydiales bacterium]|nr:MotA/TolQ/ExbB proton channel family protein [Chlamydiia bacterium]MCP5507845.1 MotA/TolQ/ExbB proton channel family protein [Chlamydiales bacterium]
MDTISNISSLFQSGSNWNIILIIIAACSVLSITVFFERFFHLRNAEIDTNTFIIALRKAIQEGNIVEATQICEQTGGTIANIVKAGIARHNRGKEQIEGAMETAGLIEIAQLEKNAKILSVIAYIAPLIGLLGTVLGFIQAFAEMRMSGLVDISATRIGEAMEYALITTAAGLVVAIPSVIAYNYIVSRVDAFILEIQTTASEIVDLLVYRDEEYTY